DVARSRRDRNAAPEGRRREGNRLRPREGRFRAEEDRPVTFSFAERRTSMRTETSSKETRSDRALWFVVLLGLIVIAFATMSHAGDPREYQWVARRTDNFSSPGKIRLLAVENISGDIQITDGPSFSAVAETIVHAASSSDA